MSLGNGLCTSERIPHIAVRGKEANKHNSVQSFVSATPFHLALQPTLPHGTQWPLSYSTVWPVRCAAPFANSAGPPPRVLASLAPQPQEEAPPTPQSHWLESSGAQPAEFLVKEMLCTNALDFIVSFVSCPLKTEKAVSEHALTPPCTDTRAHAIDRSC